MNSTSGEPKIQDQSGTGSLKSSKEQLKSIFYLLAGKPDSTIKIFEGPFVVDVTSIIELNDLIQEKFKQYSITKNLPIVSISYSNNTIKEFGTWAEFTSHSWTSSDETEEVIIRWDFMVDLPSSQTPQRHMLTVRISTDIKPSKFFQLILSCNPDEIDSADIMTAPMFCRVDFINALLGKELVNIVDGWHKARPKPIDIHPFYKFLRKHRTAYARAIHCSFSFFIFALAIILLLNRFNIDNLVIAGKEIRWLGTWFLSSFFLILFSRTFGGWLATSVFSALSQINERDIYFAMTNGDQNTIRSLHKRNSKYIRDFWLQSVWALILNLIASCLAIKFWP